MSRSFELVHFN